MIDAPVRCAEKILFHLSQAEEQTLSTTQLIELISNYSITAVRNNIFRLRRLKMIEYARKEGRATFFKLPSHEDSE